MGHTVRREAGGPAAGPGVPWRAPSQPLPQPPPRQPSAPHLLRRLLERALAAAAPQLAHQLAQLAEVFELLAQGGHLAPAGLVPHRGGAVKALRPLEQAVDVVKGLLLGVGGGRGGRGARGGWVGGVGQGARVPGAGRRPDEQRRRRRSTPRQQPTCSAMSSASMTGSHCCLKPSSRSFTVCGERGRRGGAHTW